MARDLADVCKVQHYILHHCQDPFNLHEVPKRLVNIASGQIASKAVEKSLSSLSIHGQAAFESFVTECLVEGQVKSFWDAIPRKPVLTFTDMKIQLQTDKGKKLVMVTDVLFR